MNALFLQLPADEVDDGAEYVTSNRFTADEEDQEDVGVSPRQVRYSP